MNLFTHSRPMDSFMSELEEATVDLITLTGDALLFPTISNPQPFPWKPCGALSCSKPDGKRTIFDD